MKAGNSVLLAAKMVIKNPEEVNAAIVNGKQSKEYFHRVTGHAGHHLMDSTAKYYKVAPSFEVLSFTPFLNVFALIATTLHI